VQARAWISVRCWGVLADLTEAGCSVWVAGGWGVDALVGRQTRLHRDLDLALDARNETVGCALWSVGAIAWRVTGDRSALSWC
jgi:lincosamide nucleotidyltransferase A/C/D/E